MTLKSLLLIPAAMLSSVAMAETVNLEQALDKALSFFQQSARARGQQATQSLTLAYTAQADGETYFYVFNNTAGGYVIVGGDDVAHEVLAYGESGTFDYDQLSPAARWWLGQYQNQIHYAITAERQGIPMHRAATRVAEVWPEVLPLLGDIEWGQALPYNAFILDNDQIEDVMSQYLAGCVATATTQVMRYWKYPEHGMGRHAYRYMGQQLEADFAASTYQWDLIQEKYEPAYNATPEENAVAKLTSDVGIALNMEYGKALTGGSSTYEPTIPYALRSYFGYSKNMKYLYRDSMKGLTDGEWEEIVYGELTDGRPVIYSGGNPNAAVGHSFVCDGYKDGFFHFNWGWDGEANKEYYLLTSTETTPALTPVLEIEGIGSIVMGQFDSYQSIITGIQPDLQSEGFVYLTQPMDIPAEAPLHGTLHFEGKFHNPTSHDVEALIGATLIDKNNYFTKEKGRYETYQKVMFPAEQEVTVSFDIPTDSLIPGITYNDFFEITDLSDPEITEEDYITKTWLFSKGTTHIEGPEYVRLDLSDGVVTFCLPFDIELPDGVKAYTAESITTDNRLVMKQANSLKAGVCYLVTSDEPISEPILLSGMKATDEVWGFGPVFMGNMSSVSQDYDQACYILIWVNGEDVFVRRPYTTVLAHKGIIDGSLSDAEMLHFYFDETTGIQQVGECGSNLRFNPMGQSKHDARGLIIEGGRISFVK